MAEAMIITPVIEKSIDFVFTQTYQELQYIWKFKRNLRKISRTLTGLERRREAMSLLIDAAKNNAEVIGPEVEEWLQEVEMIKNEVDEIIQGTRHAQMGCFFNCKMGCFFNCKCLNLKVRYSLSKKAAIKTVEIAKLHEKGEFSRVGYPAPIGQRTFTSPLEVFYFESRLQVEERVMKALLDEEIPVISICGMGGVGKTTMVKKIADEIRKHKLFDEVVMAVVSQNYDPINVQQQLAENLGLQFEETTLQARACRLHTRLMDQGKRILVMIDDLWEEIVLYDIGIPCGVERKGLKVLLTSRLPRICSKMDVKEIIEVGVLTEEEAWYLFKKHANISDDDSVVLKGYPKKVADKCHGLPLAIEIIGKTLKDNKHLSDWADALLGLENVQVSGTSNNEVYSRIEWSVNYLESHPRSLLLLCSLFPEDYEIEVEDLVRYAKGLQLFDGIEKMAQTRDRVERIVHELTDCYLLIACDSYRVKLHDVVRDSCLRIASKGENVYMVSHSGLREWPHRYTYESYTAISLAFDDLNELPSGLKCSRLELLRLSFRGSEMMNFIASFLHAMEKVRVLNINDSWNFKLPLQSLRTSVSLRTLNLHNCSLLGDLSALIESLLKVEVLSFYNSHYDGNWPKKISELSNLKSLDLRFRYALKDTLPTGILIHLNKLEELYLGWVLHMKLPESYEVIREIGSLSNLNTIEIGCDSDGLAILVESLDVEKLLRFCINSDLYMRSTYQVRRTMIIDGINIGMLLQPKMKALLSKVDESLELMRVTGYNDDIVKDFDGGSVSSRLRSLKLSDCEMKYIFNTTDSCTRAEFFVDLKTLTINKAEYLEELCHGDIPPGAFARLETVILKEVPLLSCLWGPIQPPCLCNLTSLQIHAGEMIRSLFSGSSVKCFARLRVIEIKYCPKLESLVSCNAQTEKDTVEEKALFPELEEVRLENVHSFKTLCSDPQAPQVLLSSTNSNISVFPKLRILTISGSDCLHVVDVTKNGQNISSLVMSMCSLEVCFDFEECYADRVFHKLDSLTLWSLPNLRRLWRNLPEGTFAFQSLTTLSIACCRSLKLLLTPRMAKMLVNLETLDIHSCEELEAIVGRGEMGPSREFSAANTLLLQEGTMVFQNLGTLSIAYCGSLKHLVTLSVANMLVSLKSLVISYCNELEAIVKFEETSMSEKVSACKGGNIFDRLEHLTLWSLPRLRIFRIPEGTIAFQNLSSLKIGRCGGLRYLLTPLMVKMFVRLKALEVNSCPQMESFIGIEEVDEAATTEVVNAEKEILLPELCDLKLVDLPELKMLCSQHVDLSLPSWKDFVVDSCPIMNKFCAGNLIAPKLKRVRFVVRFVSRGKRNSEPGEIDLDLETTMKWFKDCELGIRCIKCATSAAAGETWDRESEGSSTNKDCELGKRCINCGTSAAGEMCDHLSEGSSTN